MIKDGIGGANTRSGLQFEAKTDLRQLFTAIPGYELRETADKAGYEVWFAGKLLAHCFKKHEFYRFLKRYQIDWQADMGKQLLPDNGLLIGNILFILEVKFQNVPGSVDEKLQTCDFKCKQYTKLVHTLGWRVEYVYVLNAEWFDKPKYRDTLDYIHSVGCHYLFDQIPLKWLGLPDGTTED